MKKFYPLFLMLIFSSIIFAQTKVNFGVSTKYIDNIYNLSSQDIDKFDAGNNEFSYIETKDDLIINSYFNISRDFKSKNLEFSPFLSVHQHNYLQNNLKSTTSFKMRINKKLFNKIGIKFSYSYNPKIFVRKYIDQDGTGGYEDYQYDKQKFDLNGYFKINGKNFILFGTSLSQLYYNKYFTEYDGKKFSGNLGFKHSFKPFYLKLSYSYKIFIGDDKILSSENYTGYVRDPQYESNIYSLRILSKKINLWLPNYFRIKTASSFEQRYFRTDLSENLDPIHSGRKDKILSFSLGIDYNLLTNTNIFLDFTNVSRKVSANYEDLSKIKNYTQNGISLGFKYSFSL